MFSASRYQVVIVQKPPTSNLQLPTSNFPPPDFPTSRLPNLQLPNLQPPTSHLLTSHFQTSNFQLPTFMPSQNPDISTLFCDKLLFHEINRTVLFASGQLGLVSRSSRVDLVQMHSFFISFCISAF
jgi:hypothetical protein